MKNFILSSCLIIASLISSATVFASGEGSANDAQKAHLVIFRNVERAVTSGINYWIDVDGERVGKLTRNSVINLELSPGEHVIQSSDRNRSELVVNVQAGATTFVSATVDRKRMLSMAVTAPSDTLLAEFSGKLGAE